jgi:hypothetical protein
MKCQHCFGEIIKAHTEFTDIECWIYEDKNPQLFNIKDLYCDGDPDLWHEPLKEVKNG